MKYRITEPGWEGFTGHLGMEEFVDGVSVEAISKAEASRLACIVRIETVEDAPKNPSATQQVLDSYHTQAGLATLATADEEQGVMKQVPEQPDRVYTKEELEQIADQGGIKAIRAIAEPRGIKGAAIGDLIAKVLKAQEDAAEDGPVNPDADVLA